MLNSLKEYYSLPVLFLKILASNRLSDRVLEKKVQFGQLKERSESNAGDALKDLQSEAVLNRLR